MDNITKVLMNLITAVIHKEEIDSSQYNALSQEEEERLFQLCKKHSIGVIVGEALGGRKEVHKTEAVNSLMNEAFMAVYSYEQSKMEIGQLTKVLSEARISYIILKGPRVRQYYPIPWLRTSCDIDILVHEEDVDRAVENIVEKLSYEKQERNYHDIPMISPNNVLLELHFSIKENMDNLDRVLSKVWEYSKLVDKENSVEYRQTNEYFLFHLLAHMAYHFQSGGCGIRSVLDIYLIRHQMKYNEFKLHDLCKEAGIDTFYDYVIQLSEVWFGKQEHTQVTAAMEQFIIHGGTYGTQDNKIAMKQSKQGGGHQVYIKNRIFMSYRNLKTKYPILEKHKWLTPVYQIKRWIQMLKAGKLKQYINEAQTSKNITTQQINTTETLLKKLHLT